MISKEPMCLCFLLAAAPAAAEVQVATIDELSAALARAPEGEVISLAPGNYGGLILSSATRANRAVTLRSANPQDPARITGLTLDGVANVTLDALVFDYSFQPGDAEWSAPFVIHASSGVVIQNSIFDGDLARSLSGVADGYGTGTGLTVDGSTQVTLKRNRFFKFMRGLTVSDSDNISVVGNEVTAIRSDGMDFVAIQGLLVAENFIHDFRASSASDDHADMIQFWTTGTTRPSSDVVIRDNVLNSGSGDPTQSIFMGNELVAQGTAGPEMFYRNVAITGNVIINSHLHGITVGEVTGLTISHNTLIHNRRTDGAEDNLQLWTPRINIAEASQNVVVESNAMSAISGGENRPDWVMTDNVLIQDSNPAAPFYYDDVFVAALTGDPASLASFAYKLDGPVDGVRTGAPRLTATQ